MNRREFVTLLGGAAAAWPLAARAQQPAVPLVGFVNTRSADVSAHLVAAFDRGLAENGYIEGETVRILYRWANGQYARLPALATELASKRVGSPRCDWRRTCRNGGQGGEFRHTDRVRDRR
jgi:putative ABC transport system substrate-binding protein